MATFKMKWKKFWKYVWSLFKTSIPATFMYFCAGTILMMLTMKGETITWTSKKLTWTVVCILGGAAYNALVSWANGGTHYEMLVSGNVKRTRMADDGTGFRMSSHKEMKEYRAWKGFAIGGFTAFWTLLVGIVFGCNQSNIQAYINEEASGGFLGVFIVISFFISGWSILPFYYLNGAGYSVSYFLSCLFALIPIAVTGGFYIWGAYSRRNKAIRQQILADKAEEERQKNPKKINYGGLPGTKPRKRR